MLFLKECNIEQQHNLNKFANFKTIALIQLKNDTATVHQTFMPFVNLIYPNTVWGLRMSTNVKHKQLDDRSIFIFRHTPNLFFSAEDILKPNIFSCLVPPFFSTLNSVFIHSSIDCLFLKTSLNLLPLVFGTSPALTFLSHFSFPSQDTSPTLLHDLYNKGLIIFFAFFSD